MALLDPAPRPVAELSRAALEWDRLLELVSGYAVSAVARDWLLALAPATDRAWLDGQHALVAEASALLAAGAAIPLGGLFDPAPLLERAAIAGVALEPGEVHSLLALMDDVAAWRALLGAPPESLPGGLPALSAVSAGALSACIAALARSLRSRLLADGSLADSASPALARIRREQERQRRLIEEGLRGTLRRLSDQGRTQEELITIRGERFVIPVKAEERRRVAGVVHGSSSSGQTVYVEPLETIEQNNELARLLEQEQAEVHRIYQAMTAEIAASAPALAASARELARLDTLLARARFARDFGCVRPRFEAGRLRLEAARHPLLQKRLQAAGASVVPLTLELAGAARQLILSGPNTGGKTVALKTAALLGMMAQAGIPVPAEAATLPVFDAFLADIGDAQSIERNLSTFSAHVVNIDRIARLATPESLVVLDELGSATDPEEVIALAVAMAEFFLELGCWSLISTHHTSLKVYAAGREGAVNAAVGVEEGTLAPSYRLRLGVPGASAGIETAARLGLNPDIVAAARRRMSTRHQDIARFLDELHAGLEQLAEERARLSVREAALASELSRLEREGHAEMRRRVSELEGAAAALLRQLEEKAAGTLRQLEDRARQEKLSREAERRVAALRREFEQRLHAAGSSSRGESGGGSGIGSGIGRGIASGTGAAQRSQPPRPVAAGDTVFLRQPGGAGMGGRSARVLRRLGADSFEVAVGAMKMRVSRADLAEPPAAASGGDARPQTPVEAARRRGVSVTLASGAEDGQAELRSEINVIGRTVDEARGEVERFLDRAFLAGLDRVRIVHGTGMGVLRRELRRYLEAHPQVAALSEPAQQEGGAGATVVELRQ
jgi:DNA mismatch repair protein MutS2